MHMGARSVHLRELFCEGHNRTQVSSEMEGQGKFGEGPEL